MRAFVLTGPGSGQLVDVAEPRPGWGQVVVQVHRVGLCGTDVEFWTGRMPYLGTGHAAYPIQLGHEWSGTVSAVGEEADPGLVGRRVTGDTMIGCGQCRHCLAGHHNVCADRFEIGIRGGFPGALAEQITVPAHGLVTLPDQVDDAAGAMVEPGGNAVRCVRSANLVAGQRMLVIGTGTIGLLVAMFARREGIEVHLLGQDVTFARSLGYDAWLGRELPHLQWDAVVDCSTGADVPAQALDLVEPGGRVVFIGLSDHPSLVDTRQVVLRDLTLVGVLAASQGLAEAAAAYATGTVDPSPLVAATVGLERAGDVLGGWRPPRAGLGPKVHVDPRLA